MLTDVIEDASNELTGVVRLALQRAYCTGSSWMRSSTGATSSIAVHVRTDAQATKAAALHGIGPIGASALVAGVGDFTQFANARQFGAWLGLVPSQNSTGGKASLGAHHQTRRRLPAHAADPRREGRRDDRGQAKDRISQWLVQLKERAGWQKAVVALANKNARILWAVMTRGTTFDPDHVPQIPAAASTPSSSCAELSEPAARHIRLLQPDVRAKMPTTGQTGGR